jgi:maltose O-acetyltransferase
MAISFHRVYETCLQSAISLESSMSQPGTSSWLRTMLLKAMGVTVQGPVWMAQGTWLLNPKNLSLGQRVCIGEDSKIVCHSPIVIGDDFLSSCELLIVNGAHDLVSLKFVESPPITIGDRVWCGARVTICAGVSVGNDVVLGAGSIVTKSIPSGYVAYGVPAKPIRKLDRDEIEQIWSPLNQPSFWQRVYKKLSTKLGKNE